MLHKVVTRKGEINLVKLTLCGYLCSFLQWISFPLYLIFALCSTVYQLGLEL